MKKNLLRIFVLALTTLIVGATVNAIENSVYLGGQLRSAPNIADINGDGIKDIVIGSTDGKVFAVDMRGAILWQYPEKGNLDGQVISTPAIGNVDRDPEPEIVFTCCNGWLYILGCDGSLKLQFNTGVISPTDDPAYYHVTYPCPVLSDVNDDGILDVVTIANQDGDVNNTLMAISIDGAILWETSEANRIAGGASPATGDLNNDGVDDIVVVSISNANVLYGVLRAFDGTTGALLWTYDAGHLAEPAFHDCSMSPVIGDINNDGWNEVVFCYWYMTPPNQIVELRALTHAGQRIWSKRYNPMLITASPTLSDVNGDSYLEVLTSQTYTKDQELFIHDRVGTLISSHIVYQPPQIQHSTPVTGNGMRHIAAHLCGPADTTYTIDCVTGQKGKHATSGAMNSTAAVVDLDQNGDVEVVAGTDAGYLHIWSLTLSPIDETQGWPTFRFDARNTGCFKYESGEVLCMNPVKTQASLAGYSCISGLRVTPNPAHGRARISLAVADSSNKAVAASIYDIQGRFVRSLTLQAAAGQAVANWDCKDAEGRRVGSGVYLVSVRQAGKTVTGRLVVTQ